MLRHIKVKNFVHFYKEQDLSFDNGPHFFIGQNESGKSCMLEAMRRCMSTSKSMGMSSSHKQDEPTLVMCDFELENSQMVRSGLIRFLKNSTDVFIKFVFRLQERDLLADRLCESNTGWTVNREIPLTDETATKVRKVMIINDNELNISSNLAEDLAHILEGIEMDGHRDGYMYNPMTKCEHFLSTNIDPFLLIVYPTRAIATGQWTKSDGFEAESRKDESSETEESITKKSEIMSWYFDDNINDVTQDDRKKVRRHFRAVTNNSSFIFQKQDAVIKIKENIHAIEHKLTKVPEGYFEAKHCAILLGVAQHKTVCIEEAGKGMHPQMIERLRDLVLKTIEDKVVIITSHSPSMLSYWNISKIFFFRKLRDSRDEDKTEFSVMHGNNIFPIEDQKASRMMTNQLTSTIFFARRVLYVEGDGDLLFMTILKQVLLEDKEQYAAAIRKCDDEKSIDVDEFKRFLYSLQLISLDGHQNKEKYRKVSIALRLKHFFLMDFDVLFKKKKNIDIKKQKEQEDMTRNTPSQDHTLDIEEKTKQKDVKEQEEQDDIPSNTPSQDHTLDLEEKTKQKDVKEQEEQEDMTRNTPSQDHTRDIEEKTEQKYGMEQECQDDMARNTHSEDHTKEFLRKMRLTNVSLSDDKKAVPLLQTHGIFIWNEREETTVRKQGTIEDALIRLGKKGDEVEKAFTKNNIILQWDEDKTAERQHKFGNSTKLTSENVETVVKLILDKCAEGKGFEFERLLGFLVFACKGRCTMPWV